MKGNALTDPTTAWLAIRVGLRQQPSAPSLDRHSSLLSWHSHIAIQHQRCGMPFTLIAVANDADALLDELLRFWRSSATGLAPARADELLDYEPAVPATRRAMPAASLGVELGEQLVAEVLQGVRAGRRGVFVSEPERLRTAIFLRGYTLGRFARFAGITPSTLSRALAGQPVAPSSWQALITALLHA